MHKNRCKIKNFSILDDTYVVYLEKGGIFGISLGTFCLTGLLLITVASGVVDTAIYALTGDSIIVGNIVSLSKDTVQSSNPEETTTESTTTYEVESE